MQGFAILKKVAFWQPSFDLFGILGKLPFGGKLLVFLNYFIWIFFAYISLLLVLKDKNTFWFLFIATFLGEVVEKLGKKYSPWNRPFFSHHRHVPTGLVESWYKTGSFPSGHTLKSTYFFMFVLQYGVISPFIFLSVVLPLLVFRVVVGFHYPIDILGGAVFGFLLWFLVKIVATYVLG